MRFRLIIISLFFLLSGLYSTLSAQLIPVEDQKEFVDSLKKELDYGPYFGLYKDNYFTVGTAPFRKPTAMNSDVKFQISLAIRLTDTVLPWDSFVFLMYTQKTLWNVFQNSMPMRDLNFNPGIGWQNLFSAKTVMLVNSRSLWSMKATDATATNREAGTESLYTVLL